MPSFYYKIIFLNNFIFLHLLLSSYFAQNLLINSLIWKNIVSLASNEVGAEYIYGRRSLNDAVLFLMESVIPETENLRRNISGDLEQEMKNAGEYSLLDRELASCIKPVLMKYKDAILAIPEEDQIFDGQHFSGWRMF